KLIVGNTGRRAITGFKADTNGCTTFHTAVGDAGHTGRTVGAEDTFLHTGNITAVEGHINLIGGTTVLTQGLAGVADNTVAYPQGARRIYLEELVTSIVTRNVADIHRTG